MKVFNIKRVSISKIQGLPCTVTSQLTIIARQMAKKNVFLKRLDIIETFGAATIVASDKTGTLTKNDMTVSDLWYDGKFSAGMPEIRQRTLSAKRNSIARAIGIIDLLDQPLPMMFRVMCICNKGKVDNQGEIPVVQSAWQHQPNKPTDSEVTMPGTVLNKDATVQL